MTKKVIYGRNNNQFKLFSKILKWYLKYYQMPSFCRESAFKYLKKITNT